MLFYWSKPPTAYRLTVYLLVVFGLAAEVGQVIFTVANSLIVPVRHEM